MERNRIDGQPDIIGVYTHKNNAGVPVQAVNCTMFRDIKTMTDVVTSNYHHRISKGEIINNPMTFFVDKVKSTGTSSYFAEYTGLPYDSYSGSGGSVTTFIVNQGTLYGSGVGLDQLHFCSEPVIDDMVQRAKQKALSDVDSTPKEFMEDLFEIKETIEFLKSPLRSLSNAAKAFSRKESHILKNELWDARKRAEALADLWSTWSFAASPLVRSMMDILEVYNERKNSRDNRTRRNARGWDYQTDSHEGEFNYTVSDQVFTIEREERRDIIVKAHILYEVTNPLEDWRFHLGLRLKDIPETLWAVMPLSFMVDRLYNISRVIRGVTNYLDPSLTFLASSYTIRHSRFVSNKALTQEGPNWVTTIEGDTWTRNWFGYSRHLWEPSILDAFPLALNAKDLVRDLSSISDLVALIVLNLRGVGR